MPPLSRVPHEASTTTTSAPCLRAQASQSSIRSNATATSARTTRQQGNDLFAPTLSRRPTGRARAEDDVLADSGSEQETAVTHRPRPHARRVRHGTPEARHTRQRPRPQLEEQDIVNRQADGNYLLGAVSLHAPVSAQLFGQQAHEEEDQNEEEYLDQRYAETARKYFTSSGRQSKSFEEELERDRHDMTARLRQQVMRKLEEERWLYEAATS